MVGNDATEDLAAASAGLEVFLLTDCLINREGKDLTPAPSGSPGPCPASPPPRPGDGSRKRPWPSETPAGKRPQTAEASRSDICPDWTVETLEELPALLETL